MLPALRYVNKYLAVLPGRHRNHDVVTGIFALNIGSECHYCVHYRCLCRSGASLIVCGGSLRGRQLCMHGPIVHAHSLILCMHGTFKCTCIECTCICNEDSWKCVSQLGAAAPCCEAFAVEGPPRREESAETGERKAAEVRGDTIPALSADIGDARARRIDAYVPRSAHGRAKPLGGVLRASVPRAPTLRGHQLRRRPPLLPAQAAAGFFLSLSPHPISGPWRARRECGSGFRGGLWDESAYLAGIARVHS